MSILRVANLQFNASGTRRIDYDAVGDDGIIKISAAAVKLPVGDTASRPTSQAGMIRYNSQLDLFEGANSTTWGSIGGTVDFATANGWANAVGTAGNNYTNYVGASANSYATTMDTAGNNYTNSVGLAGNNYTNAVGLAGNNYVNSVVFPAANTALQNTSGISFNGNFYIPNGNLGIGTNSPSHKLHVANGNMAITSSTGAGQISITDDSDSGRGLLLKSNHSGTSNTYVGTNSSIKNLIFGIDSIERMRLDTSGNLGIGVASPTGKLDVASRGITKGSMPAGSVLQVVSVYDRQQSSYTTVDIGTNSNYGYNEAGFDLTTLDIALTPTSSSSKILIMTNINLGSWDQQYGVMRLKRGIGGATPTWSSSDPWMSAGNAVPGTATQLGSYIVTNRATGWQATHIHFQWLDSPGTTSEVKYRFNFRIEADATAAIAYLNRAAYNTNDYGSTGAVSSVTLMEIAV